ncbi:MAG: hypothetical protein LBQ12_04900 [Deltaproteobacteria bacterium]|jgi:hypothetical protein|nr:hypothetical protein [Deltaproteobacteria bacterium]
MAPGKKNKDKDTPPSGLAPEDEFMAVAADVKGLCPDGFPLELVRDYWKCFFGFVVDFRKTASRADQGGLDSSQLEDLLGSLAHAQNGLNLKLLRSELANYDQTPLIAKKKREAKARGEIVKIYRWAPRTLITCSGPVTFSRLSLIRSRGSGERERAPWTSWEMAFPLDEAMGTSRLPFKMTCRAMLEISRLAAMTLSYDAARQTLARERFIAITGVTIRAVANRLGELVLSGDLARASAAWNEWHLPGSPPSAAPAASVPVLAAPPASVPG